MRSIDKIDLTNIGLMALSCVLAFLLPFELFLFSYAVLGPLHYLTEIGWLHQKGYYTKGKYDFVVLVALACFITLGFFKITPWFNSVTTNFIYIAFLCGIALAAIRDNTLKTLAVIAIVFSTLFVSNWAYHETFFAIYLPTIIHVFLFTALFMLYGALKNRSAIGVLSVGLLFLCAGLFFLIPAPIARAAKLEYLQLSYGGFAELNRNLINFFGLAKLNPFSAETAAHNINTIFSSKEGFVVMRFVAFAYTYHYLNWFSKTSVIQWHKVPKPRLYFVLAVWLASVALYLYDYGVGLKWLFLLSFLHVLLEFPLNYLSISGIFSELKKRLFIEKGAQTSIKA
jgi:hypothetical protein